MAEKTPLPYPCITVAGKDALAEWERLRKEGKGWPVVIGSDKDREFLAESFAFNAEYSPAQTLEEAAAIVFPDVVRERLAEEGEYDEEYEQAPDGEWETLPDDPDPHLTVATDILSGQFHEQVHILLLPTQNGWEAPAWLRWGAWNECPPPEEHVAALRHWHDKFGAELIGITNDVLNLRVKRRPKDREEALALAYDQYVYCTDIVDQGVETISALAATLLSSDWWYFWWD